MLHTWFSQQGPANISKYCWINDVNPCFSSSSTKWKQLEIFVPGIVVVVIQLPSCVWLSAAPWTAAHQASLSPVAIDLFLHWHAWEKSSVWVFWWYFSFALYNTIWKPACTTCQQLTLKCYSGYQTRCV